MDMRINEYITIQTAAKLLGVTPNTLRNWERAGIVRVYRNPINNYRLYKVEEIEEVLRNIK